MKKQLGAAVVGLWMVCLAATAALAEPNGSGGGQDPAFTGARLKKNMISFDLTIIGGTMEYARRMSDNRLFGFGGGIDVPFMGYMVYAGRHFAEHDGWSYEEKDGYESKDLLEIAHANFFIRHELLGRKMHLDTGLRASLFLHFDSSDDDPGGGFFAGTYITLLYGWERIKFGSRVQAGIFHEHEGEFGVFLSPFIVRITFPW